MQKKNHRPKSYDFFKGKKNPSENGLKNKKNIWKWFKVFLYIFIFATTLTGCIQSFVVKSSSKVGSGVEFYNSEEGISPNAVVFKEEKIDDKKQKLVIQSKGDNFLISDNKYDNRSKVINSLREQTKNNGGQYASWGSYNSLIVFRDGSEYKPIAGKNNEGFLFITSDTKTTTAKLEWTNIKVLSAKALSAIEIKNKKDPNNSTETLVSNDEMIWKIDNDINFLSNVNATFSRDIVQFVYNRISNFTQYKDKIENAFLEIEKNGIQANEKDLNLAKDFTNDIQPFLKNTFFEKVDLKNKTISFGTTSPNLDNSFQGMAYRSSEVQKVIITWGDAWKLGPFYGLFIWPMSKFMLLISNSMPYMAGWSSIITILIAVLLTKTLSFGLRFKTLFSQSKQAELQAKKAKIDAKYLAFKGDKAMEQKQRQEVAELYRKNNFSPMAPLSQVLITMPIFIAMWRIVQGIPVIKSATWLGINLASTSWQELFNNKEWIYLPLLIIVLVVQIIQQILPRILSKKNTKRIMNATEAATLKKQNKTQNIMMIVFIFMGVMFQASVQIYWIIGGLWEIGQILFVHYFQKSKIFKEKVKPWLNKEKRI